jgi:hypothetical protein
MSKVVPLGDADDHVTPFVVDLALERGHDLVHLAADCEKMELEKSLQL